MITIRTLPKWLGARPEPLTVSIVGDIAPWRWPRDWYYVLVSAPCIRPYPKLQTVLYPRKETK